MSNIFNALERARHERHKDDTSSRDTGCLPEKKVSIESGVLSDTSTDVEIADMFRMMQEQLNEGRWALQLISTQAGEGVSFVAKRLAKVSHEMLSKEVLLIRLVTSAAEADAGFYKEQKLQELASRLEERANASSEATCRRFVEVSMPFNWFFKELKKDSKSLLDIKRCYDIIIFDTPSTALEPNSAEFASYVDAVLIVLEAEKTKVFAVQTLTDKIKHVSDCFVGVVLNKRCFHIPYSLYSKLH